jgi:hypothetical protein
MDNITLGNDPWSKRLFNKMELLPSLTKAVGGDFAEYDSFVDASPFWIGEKERRKELTRKLIDSMKDYKGNIEEVWIRKNKEINYVGGPICVHIGEDGNFFIVDGNHRICILKAMGLSIEARVLVRADRWIKLKEDAFKIYDRKHTYQPFTHPDFADWDSARKDTRIEKIKPFISGDIVNLGCAEGYMDLILSEYADKWTAYENHNVRGKMAEYQLQGSKVKLIREDFYSNHIPKCNTLLLLSVFHHQWRVDKEKAVKLLNKIDNVADKFILEVAMPREDLWGEDVPDIQKLIVEKTSYKKAVKISDEEPREIYLFEK